MSIMSGMTYFHKIFNHNYNFAKLPLRKCKECEKIQNCFDQTLDVWDHKGALVFVFLHWRIYKPQSGCQREHDNRNSFILHSSVLPKLIVGHCVSAVKSEVCTFECSHGAYTILTLLWFSNSRTQSFLKLNYGLLTQLLFWWSQCKRKIKDTISTLEDQEITR